MTTTPLLTLEDAMAHPLWEVQVALEQGMKDDGEARVQERVVDAVEKDRMTNLKPVTGLLTEWLPKVAVALGDYLKACARSRGPKPIAASYLCATSDVRLAKHMVDAHTASLIALRTMLNGMASERIAVTSLAIEIGRMVEHEAQVRLWASQNPKLFQTIQGRLSEQGSTAHHRARVNIHEFNRTLAKGGIEGGWEAWGSEVHFRVGVMLIDNIVRVTGWFTYVDDPNHVYRSGKANSPRRVVLPKEHLTKWLSEAIAREKLLSPVLKPTVIPPKRWEGTRQGGYWTPFVKGPRLIRFKVSQETQRERAADEYEALDMPKVYDAVHYLQEVPWRVNRKVLEAAQRLFDAGHGEAKLPRAPVEHWEEMPAHLKQASSELSAWRKLHPEADTVAPELAEKDAAVRNWKRQRSVEKRTDIRTASRHAAAQTTLGLAWDYAEFDRIYFPHMLDFRGRVYPIPTHLQPQGADLAKGLLEFAEGREITEENGGAWWLAIQLASVWGNDKWDFDKRIAWVEKNEAMWRSIAADPLADKRWAVSEGPHKVDKPFAALAAIFEWVAFLDHGFGFVSHLPVAVDGTCNGIQHLSAMTRDEVAGRLVNLCPSEDPADIYQTVADLLSKDLERIKAGGGVAGEHATYWLGLGIDGLLPRTLTKRQVMVLPYGGTKDSFFTYTREWLDEHDPLKLPKDCPDEERRAAYAERTQRISLLTGRLWDIVGEVVSGGVAVMKWLQDCAKHATVANQPIFWVTPSGFVVRHFYGVQKDREMVVSLDGTRVKLRMGVTTKELDIKSQLQGIAPNFVHSLDASALVDTVVLARDAGLAAITSVHDAYGTHAADMWALFKLLREAFVETHQHDILALFRNACHSVLVGVLVAEGKDPLEAAQIADEKLPPPPRLGTLDIRAVLSSDYFFA